MFMLQSSSEVSTLGNTIEVNQNNPESSKCQENHDQGIAKGSYESRHDSCQDHASISAVCCQPCTAFQEYPIRFNRSQF